MNGLNFKQYFDYRKKQNNILSKVNFEKSTFTYSKLKEKKLPFVESASVFSILKKTDEAMLNSILSFAVYDRNSWMMKNLKSELSDMTAIIQDAMRDKEKMYGLKVWHFMKKTFEKIPDHELKIPAKGFSKSSYNSTVQYDFSDGQYSAANGLAHACILKSKSLDGDGEILHLSFRGTEFSRLMEYLKGPYLDMSAYYENFKPLEKYIRDYVNNPINNITEVHVNGHSLGGAMVQEFLKHNPENTFAVPIKGFTFGSPGSEKKWYHKFATIAYHSLGKGVPFKNPYPDHLPSHLDDRMTQFYHSNDPVPIIGLLGYSKGANNYKLPDINYEESKLANLEQKGFLEKIPAFGKLITYFKENILHKFDTKFHDSARYIMNLRHHIENSYKEHPALGKIFSADSTKNWQNWLKQEQEFGTLSIRYKSAFEYLVKKDEPNLNKEEVNEKILQLRERMKYDSEARMILSRIKNQTNYNKLVSHDNTVTENILLKIKNKDHYNKFLNNHDSLKQKFTNISSSNDVDSVKAAERIQRLKASYEEKMEARAAVFKKTIDPN